MGNHAAEIRAKVQQDHPGATVRRRGRRFIEHTLPDGRIQWTGTIDYLHYGPQADQEIDTTWQVAVAPNAWQFNQGLYSATARPTFNVGQIMTFIHESGESVDFQPQALEFSNDSDQLQQISIPLPVVAVPNDSVLRWANAYGVGLDVEWTLLPDKLKLELTIPALASLPVPNATILAGGNPYLSFRFIFQRSSGIRIWVDGVEWNQNANNPVDTEGVVEFRSVATGAVLWVFEPASAFDESHRFTTVRTYLRRQGNSLFVQVRLPWADLQVAAFPVIIDPSPYSSQPDATAGNDHYISSSGSGTWTGGGTATNLRSGQKDTTPFDVERTLIKFDLSSIPTDATIDDATWTVYMYKVGTQYADADYNSKMHRLRSGRDWVEGQASNVNYKTSNAWTTAGGDDTTNDRESTVLGTIAFLQTDAVDAAKSATFTASLVQEWVDLTLTNNGWISKGEFESRDQYSFWSSDHSSATERPKFVINYTTGTAYNQAAAGSVTPTGASQKSIGKVVAGSLTPAGAALKLVAKSFAGAITPAGTAIKQAAKTFAGSLTPAGAQIRSTLKVVAGSVTPGGVVATARTIAKAIAGAVTPGGALVRDVSTSVAGTIAPVGVLIRSTGKILAGSITPGGVLATLRVVLQAVEGGITASGALIRQTGKIVSGSLTPSATIIRQVAKSLSGSISPVGVLAALRVVFQAVEGGITATGVLARQTGKVISGSLSPGGVLSKALTIAKAIGGSITPVGTLLRLTAINLVGSITPGGVLGTLKATFLAIGGILAPAGELVRGTGVNIGGALTPVGTIIKSAAIALSGSITPGGVLAVFKGTLQAVGGSITATGTVVRATSKSVIGAITPVGTLIRNTAKLLAGSLTPGGILASSLTFTKAIAGFITPVGAMVRQTSKVVSGSLTPGGTIARSVAVLLAGSITPVGAILRSTSKIIAGAITPGGVVATSRTFVKAIAGILTPTGALVRQTAKSFAGSITPVGAIARSIGKLVAGAISPIGALLKAVVGAGQPVIDVAMTDSAVTTLTISDTIVYTVTISDAQLAGAALSDKTRA